MISFSQATLYTAYISSQGLAIQIKIERTTNAKVFSFYTAPTISRKGSCYFKLKSTAMRQIV